MLHLSFYLQLSQMRTFDIENKVRSWDEKFLLLSCLYNFQCNLVKCRIIFLLSFILFILFLLSKCFPYGNAMSMPCLLTFESILFCRLRKFVSEPLLWREVDTIMAALRQTTPDSQTSFLAYLFNMLPKGDKKLELTDSTFFFFYGILIKMLRRERKEKICCIDIYGD